LMPSFQSVLRPPNASFIDAVLHAVDGAR